MSTSFVNCALRRSALSARRSAPMAPHESGILGRELSNPLLHVFDHAALFGDLVFAGGDPVGHALTLAGSDELVEDPAMIGIDSVRPTPAGTAIASGVKGKRLAVWRLNPEYTLARSVAKGCSLGKLSSLRRCR
ncbi:hypothetical protein [Mesorhizobium sp. WSM2561]|uniref:hypothetical protein n=1 Tax=Mesorhizobium sp. WSM2561 TaxID=1040985 RepID=UPI0005689C25|nr:hypothetical protein [Mesorhizobium sp. WSM2561]